MNSKITKIGILLLGFIFLMPFVFAETDGSILVGKQNECISLPQECSSCSYVNITSIQYPNMTRIFINSAMTKQGVSFDYNYCNTSQLGDYVYCMLGDVDGIDTSVCKDFSVTSSGDSFGTSQAIILLGLFGFMGLLFGISYSFSKEKWKLKSFFQMGSIFIGIILLNSIRILLGTSSNLASMGSVGLIIGIVILSFMVLYIMLLYTIEVFNYFKKRNRDKWEIGDSYS